MAFFPSSCTSAQLLPRGLHRGLVIEVVYVPAVHARDTAIGVRPSFWAGRPRFGTFAKVYTVFRAQGRQVRAAKQLRKQQQQRCGIVFGYHTRLQVLNSVIKDYG
jgi:hypothetical protein